MTNLAHTLTNSVDFDSVLKKLGFIVDRKNSKYWNLVKCFDYRDEKWKTLSYLEVKGQICYQFYIFDYKEQPAPPKVKLRKSENKLFKRDEELFFGDKYFRPASVKNILESIHLDASKLDMTDA